jgi:hypothetical protein
MAACAVYSHARTGRSGAAFRTVAYILLLCFSATHSRGAVLHSDAQSQADRLVADPDTASADVGEILKRPDDSVNPKATLRDAGETSLADAIQENAAVRRILRGVVLRTEPLDVVRELERRILAIEVDPGESAVSDPNARRPATRERRAATSAPARDPGNERVITIDNDVDVASVRQVLRAIVAGARAQPVQADEPPADGDDAPAEGDDLAGGPKFDLADRLLDSRFLGALIDDIVQVNPYDSTFSLFGMGQFEIVTGPAGRGVTVTERSSDLSFTVGAQAYPEPVRAPRRNGPRLQLLALILDFLQSTTGILVTIGTAISLLMLGSYRVAIRLRH